MWIKYLKISEHFYNSLATTGWQNPSYFESLDIMKLYDDVVVQLLSRVQLL